MIGIKLETKFNQQKHIYKKDGNQKNDDYII